MYEAVAGYSAGSEFRGGKVEPACAWVVDPEYSVTMPMRAVRDYTCVDTKYVMSFGYSDKSMASAGPQLGKNGDGACCEHGCCRVGGMEAGSDSGYCYLGLVRDAYVEEVRSVIGPWPGICELVEIPREMIDPERLDSMRAVRVGGGWHMSQVGDVSVARLLQLAAERGCRFTDQNSLGYALQDLKFGDEQYELDGLVGGNPLDCDELRDLYRKDFSVCRCKVHDMPITKNLPGASVGCVQKPAGKASVIQGAFSGTGRMCHVDDAVRQQDKAMLGIVLSDTDPRTLDGEARLPALAALCTSSETADLASFGNGYCYLALLHHDAWWRVARILGPNPLLSSLHRVVLWLGKSSFKRHTLMRVSDGYYHVVVDKSSKGIVSHAGRDIFTQIADVLRVCPRARVGGLPLPLVVLEGFDAHLADLLGVLKRLSREESFLGLHGVVWLSAPDNPMQEARQLFSSAVVAVEPVLSPAGYVDYVYRFSVRVPGLAVVVVPKGWMVEHQSLAIGHPRSDLFAIFRDYCSVELVPFDRKLIGLGRPVNVSVIFGERVTRFASTMLHPKSTDARFFRKTGATAVLRCPSVVPGDSYGREHLDRVQVSDPLLDWEPIADCRWQADDQEFGTVYKVSAYGYRAYSRFLCTRKGLLVLNKFVRVFHVDACVSISGPVLFKLEAAGQDGAVRKELSKVCFSFHEYECVDSYSMDGGGPSDSEFSDAI